jgi:hypothetical protein
MERLVVLEEEIICKCVPMGKEEVERLEGFFEY